MGFLDRLICLVGIYPALPVVQLAVLCRLLLVVDSKLPLSNTSTRNSDSCRSDSVSSGIGSKVAVVGVVVAAAGSASVALALASSLSSGSFACGATYSSCTRNCIVNSGSVFLIELNSASEVE